MSPIRAAVIGYQGFGNLGDEAILTGIQELIEDTELEVAVVFCGDSFPVSAFPNAKRQTSRRLVPTLSGIRALSGVSVLIMSGGGLLHDHWRGVVPTYLAWSITARMLGIRVVWLGVGVGPLRRSFWRKLTAWTLRLSALVTVRDMGSAALVQRIAPNVRAEVIPDPAIFNPIPHGQPGGGMAVVVRPPAPRDWEVAPSLAAALGEAAARRSRETGSPVTILTFGGAGDDSFAEQVARRAATAGCSHPVVERLTPDPAVGLGRLAKFDLIVTVRLHGFILGTLLGVPTAAIAYDEKVSAYALAIGAPEVVVPLRETSAKRIDGAVHAAQDGDRQAAIARAVSNLRMRKREVAERLVRAAAGS